MGSLLVMHFGLAHFTMPMSSSGRDDDIQLYVGSHHGNAVDFIVCEELVGNLNDAFLAQLLALEVETDGDVIAHLLQTEEGYHGEKLFGGYVVDDGTVLQCGYLQFFLVVHSVLIKNEELRMKNWEWRMKSRKAVLILPEMLHLSFLVLHWSESCLTSSSVMPNTSHRMACRA